MSTTTTDAGPITGSRSGLIVTASTVPILPAPALATVTAAWQVLFFALHGAHGLPALLRTPTRGPRIDMVRASYSNPFMTTVVVGVSKRVAQVVATAMVAFTDELDTRLADRITLDEAAGWVVPAVQVSAYVSAATQGVYSDPAPLVPMPTGRRVQEIAQVIDDTCQAMADRDSTSGYRWANVTSKQVADTMHTHVVQAAVVSALIGQDIAVVDERDAFTVEPARVIE